MADLCVEYSFAGLTINDNTDTVDRLVLPADGITGLDGRPIRRQVDPRGIIDGSIVFESFFAARIITFKGHVEINTVPFLGSITTAYAAAVMNLEDTVKAALEGVVNTPTALTWTQSNGNAESVTCVYGMPGGELQFGGEMAVPTFQFTLIEATTFISL